MDLELKLIYEKTAVDVNGKARGYNRPKIGKVLDLIVHFRLTLLASFSKLLQ